jgi:hypothetical protein
MIKNNSTCRIFLTFIASILISFNGYSQPGPVVGGTATFSETHYINGHYSDYYINLIWSNFSFNTDHSACDSFYVFAGYNVTPNTPLATQYFSIIASGPGGSGSYLDAVGPGIGKDYYLDIERADFQCYPGQPPSYGYLGSWTDTLYQGYFNDGPESILAPTGISYLVDTAPSGFRFMKITWNKGSDIPNGNQLIYRIYRNHILIDSVASTAALIYTDSTYLPTGLYTYAVTSYTPAIGNPGWFAQESAKDSVVIPFNDGILQASDGTIVGETQLIWRNIAFLAPNDIALLRNGQQIAVVNKNTTQYGDYSGVPGLKYVYAVAPINANNIAPYAYPDSGYGKPNGVLTGYIRSILGSGVPGATVTATATVDGQTYTYTDSTDATGYYSINNIYYDTIANYTVVPSKGNDRFNPASVSRNLTLQNYNNSLPDMIDTTVFTISGTVNFAGTTGCHVVGALLYVNGNYSGVVTDAGGVYRYTALQQGRYLLSVKFGNHTFDSLTRTVQVVSSVTGIDFHDTKTDILVIDLKSGCHSQVVDAANFEVISDPTTSNAGCFDSICHFDGFTPVTLVLPALPYRIEIKTATNNGSPDLNYETTPNGPIDPISVDLTMRDTVHFTRIDTSYTYITTPNDTLPNLVIIYGTRDTIRHIDTVNSFITPYAAARFVTHGTLSIQLTNVDTFCGGYVVQQGVPFPMQIYVRENDTHRGQTNTCLQDTGQVRIYDGVSGAGLIYTQLVNGQINYIMSPGTPNVPDNTMSAHQYRNLFEVHVEAGQAPTLDAWMLILGNKQLTATIFDKTPPIPFMVLHDPPGSASFSSWEKDSSISLNTTTLANNLLGGGGYVGVKVGNAFTPPLTGLHIPGTYVNVQVQGGYTKATDNNTSQTMTITANRTISTSSDPNYVGFNGDVFIGAAVIRKIAFAYDLKIDSATCGIKQDTILITGIDSMASTFIYSALDIRNAVIPQLAGFLAAAPDSEKIIFQSQINMWNQVLAKDSATIAASHYSQNITMTAGILYDYTVSSDSNFQNTYDVVETGNISASAGIGFADAVLIDINAGATFQWSTSSTHQTNGTADRTTTFSYHLEDDIPGNILGINIGHDPHFGSPIFNLFGGTSGCPWEPGTQQRDVPTLSITPGEVDNVPPAAVAAFQALLGNQSESQEARTYQVSVAPESNLDGATIKIGGQDITQNPGTFTVPYAQTLTATLTVEKGPFVADYDSLIINFSSACDANISVSVPITVHFQSTCSAVSLAAPNDGWLANSNNNDTLSISFTGFNVSNPNLQEIGLEYRLANSTQAWSTGPVIPLARLTQQFVTVPFNISNLPDGNYQLRAYASCGSGNGGNTYSALSNGVIDRASFSVYGTPQPASGVLDLGSNISVQFNNPVDCNQTYERMKVSLKRADNDSIIPSSFTCFGNGLVITTNPPSLLNTLDGATLIASVDRVHDLNGNLQNNPIVWSFLVNRSKIYWSPANANVTAVKGSSALVSGTMLNVGPVDSFTIIKIPAWLSLSQAGPYQLAQGTPQSPTQFQLGFTASNSLNQGHYVDTVIALAAGKKQFFFVTLDVVTQGPTWSVNPAAYQYSMNITANYSTTQLNTPLSTDRRDLIAAFVGNQCRGVGYISYDATTDKYAAFITAYSNSTVGDTFKFRIWDALPGIEYQAKERLPFIDNISIGQPLAPYILHPEGEFQTIVLSAGWNWFSLNVAATDMSPKNVLGSIKGNNAAVVKGQNLYDQFTSPANGWTGALATFDTKSSYMINLDHADTLHFLGQLVDTPVTLQIASGWNWIGFPRHKITTATSFLINLNPSNGDLLKSETLFTQFNAGTWSGNLSYMYPGQGYKLNSANSINFVIPIDRNLPSWSAQEYMFQQNMSVTADLQFNGVSTTQSHYLVGAFANGICVGTGQPEFLQSLNLYRVYMTIHGDVSNAGQALTFKVYDTDNDVEYTPTYLPVSVAPDTVVAKVELPYVINVQTATGINAFTYTDGFSLLQNIPNPFAKTTNIEYTIPASQQVTLTLYDESGRLIRELVNGMQSVGTHKISFEQDNLQSGVYFYQMKSGEFVKTRRMMIIQ